MKLNFRFLILAVLTSVFVAAITVLVGWQNFRSTRSTEIEIGVSRQLTSTVKTIELTSDYLKRSLFWVAQQEAESVRKSGKSFSSKPLSAEMSKSDFSLVGQLQSNGAKKWESLWTSQQNLELTISSVEKILAQLPGVEDIDKAKVNYFPVQVPEGDKWVAILFQKDANVFWGLLPLQIFNLVVRNLNSDQMQAYVTSAKTFALAHPESQYLGSAIANLELVQKMNQSAKVADTFSFDNWSGQSFEGGFELAEGSNLQVAIMVPMKGFFDYIKDQLLGVLMGLFCAIALGFFAAQYLLRPLTSLADYYQESLRNLASGQKLFPPENKNAESLEAVQIFENLERQLQDIADSHQPVRVLEKPVVAADGSKMENVYRLVLKKLQLPINAVIGHIQSMKIQTDPNQMLSNLKHAETEVRKVKAFVEDLNFIVQRGEIKNQPVMLNDAVGDLIRDKVKLFNTKAIRVHKKLFSKKHVKANAVYLDHAISYMIDYFAECFSEQIQRDLFFSLEDDKVDIRLRIECNSEQLNVGVLSSLLQPFSSTHDQENFIKLAVSKTLTEQMGGVISVNQGLHGGVEIVLSFPVMRDQDVEKYFEANDLPENKLETPVRDEVSKVVEPVKIDEDFKVLMAFNHKTEEIIEEASFSGFHEVDNESVDRKIEFPLMAPKSLISDEKSLVLEDDNSADFVMVKTEKSEVIAPPVEKTKMNRVTNGAANGSSKPPTNGKSPFKTNLPEPKSAPARGAEFDQTQVMIRRPKVKGED